jgi:hypothetical protein
LARLLTEKRDGCAVCTSKVTVARRGLGSCSEQSSKQQSMKARLSQSELACHPCPLQQPWRGGPKIAGCSRRITNNIPLSLSSTYALCRPSQSRVNALRNCPSYGLVDTSDYGVLLLQRVSSWHSSLPQMLFGCPMSSLSVSVTLLHSFQDLNV